MRPDISNLLEIQNACLYRDDSLIFSDIDFHIEVKNPPGVLTDELVHAINQSLNDPPSRKKTTNQSMNQSLRTI